MDTQEIWNNFKQELYGFLLKRVKDKNITDDIFQSTFLKVHKNLPKLKDEGKVRSWVFQIARNEIANYFNTESFFSEQSDTTEEITTQEYQFVCCFDRLVNELPETYKEVIELIYIKGKKQKQVADELEISLENVKVRVKRAKEMLKVKFKDCCKYTLDKNGKLVGEPNCSVC